MAVGQRTFNWWKYKYPWGLEESVGGFPSTSCLLANRWKARSGNILNVFGWKDENEFLKRLYLEMLLSYFSSLTIYGPDNRS